MMLLTQSGGHVGWPMGMNPTKHAWEWMSEVAMSFVESAELVLATRKSKSTVANGKESIESSSADIQHLCPEAELKQGRQELRMDMSLGTC